MNTDINNKTTATEENSPHPTTNKEILSLLRKFVEQNTTDKTNDSRCHGLERWHRKSYKTEPSHGNARDDTTTEIKSPLAELLKKQTNNATATETMDDDLDDDFDDDDDDDDDGEIIAEQDSDFETSATLPVVSPSSVWALCSITG